MDTISIPLTTFSALTAITLLTGCSTIACDCPNYLEKSPSAGDVSVAPPGEAYKLYQGVMQY